MKSLNKKLYTYFLIIFIAISGIIFIIFLIAPSENRPEIEIKNLMETPMQNITVKVAGNIITIDTIPKRGAKIIQLALPFLESEVELMYEVDGRVKQWRGGLIKNNGYHIYDIIVGKDGEINFLGDKE